jgi:hypothetical protein
MENTLPAAPGPATTDLTSNPQSPLDAEPTDAVTQSTCPTCHQTVRSSDYYCYNCGFNLKPAPPSTTLSSQLQLYIKSALLPPLGIIWGYKYLKQAELKSKIVGLVAMAITIGVLVFVVTSTIKLIDIINEQVNLQMQNIAF